MDDMTEEYECHITCVKPETTYYLEQLAKERKWKTSYIVGDPLLGNEGFFYFTCHSNSYDKIFSKMELLYIKLIELFGSKLVIRKKIEKVVYDTKRITGVYSEPKSTNIPK